MRRKLPNKRKYVKLNLLLTWEIRNIERIESYIYLSQAILRLSDLSEQQGSLVSVSSLNLT